MSDQNKNTSPASFRHSMIAVLAKALLDLFPGLHLEEAFTSHFYFGWNIESQIVIGEDALEMIEMRMREIIREKPPTRSLEMIPSNAFEYFESVKQPLLAFNCSDSENFLIHLMEIGQERYPVPSPIEENLSLLRDFRLLTVVDQGDVIRVEGVIFTHRRDLKLFQKRLIQLKDYDAVSLGKQLDLFLTKSESEDWIWLTKGLTLKQLIRNAYEKFIAKHEFYLIGTENHTIEEHQMVANHLNITRTTEWNGNGDLGFCHCSPRELNEVLISCLHSSLEWIKMMNLEAQCFLVESYSEKYHKETKSLKRALKDSKIDYEIDNETASSDGPKVSIRIADGLGRLWECSLLSLSSYPIFSLITSVKRLVTLLLEKYQGAFPMSWAPEQIRFLPLSPLAILEANSLAESLRQEGLRVYVDESQESLDKRIYRFETLKIPYAVVIGEKELSENAVIIRERAPSQEKIYLKEEEINDFFKKLVR